MEESINYIAVNGKESENNADILKKKLLNLINTDNVTDRVYSEHQHEEILKNFQFNQYDESIAEKAIAEGMKVYKIEIVLKKDCMLKSARAFVVFKSVEKYAEIFKSYPAAEDIEDEKFDNRFRIAIITGESKERIKKDIESISEIDDVIIERILHIK